MNVDFFFEVVLTSNRLCTQAPYISSAANHPCLPPTNVRTRLVPHGFEGCASYPARGGQAPSVPGARGGGVSGLLLRADLLRVCKQLSAASFRNHQARRWGARSPGVSASWVATLSRSSVMIAERARTGLELRQPARRSETWPTLLIIEIQASTWIQTKRPTHKTLSGSMPSSKSWQQRQLVRN